MTGDWLAAGLLLAGALWAVVAALGVARLPDALLRMHAATKAGAFGAALLLLGAALAVGTLRAWVEALLVVVFFYATAPVAAHALGRAALRGGVPLDPRTAPREDRPAEPGAASPRPPSPPKV